MSRKRILNISSRKKRDTMQPFTSLATGNSSGGPPVPNKPANGGDASMYAWCATARDNTTSTTGGAGNVFQESARTATTCYMRGLKETIEIQTSSGIPWQWRRICVTMKANFTGVDTSLETSAGWVRNVYNMTSGQSADANALSTLRNALFQGQINTDWTSYLTAPVDTTRVDLKYDKTMMVSSGNASGKLKLYKMWHPMNKNLVYNDDENASGTAVQKYSVTSKPGMGDYYVIDIFQSGIGSASGDVLSFQPQATLYWHEK